jgi:hypothetical protein
MEAQMKSRKTTVLESIQENLTVSVIIFLCAVIGVLDFFGLLDGLPVISQRIPSVTVLLLSTLAIYVVFIQPRKLEEAQTTQIKDTVYRIDSLQETRVRFFDDSTSCIDYAHRCVEAAIVKVYCMFWDVDMNFDQSATKDILHKEILLIDEKNKRQYQAKLKGRFKKSRPSHSFAYFRADREAVLQFMIIDSAEVIFLSNLSPYNMAIRHPKIASVFEHHYEDIWQKATKLKQYDRIFSDRIDMALAEQLNVFQEDLEKCVRECLKAQEQRRQMQRLS